MDATVRRSSRRVHTLIALTVLACVFFLAVFSSNSGARSIVLHDRRDIFIRQDGARSSTSAATTETSSSGPSLTSSGSSSVSSQSSTTIISSATSFTQLSSSVSTTSATHSSIFSQPTSTSTSHFQTSTESTTTQSSTSSSTTQLPTSTTSTISRTTLSLIPVSVASSFSENFNPQPATTIGIATNALQISAIETTTPLPQPPSDASSTLPMTNTSSSASAAAKPSGFWQNKGAVAATFVIVSLVLLAIAAVVVISYLKRRSSRRQDHIHEELFEKFSDSGHRSNSPGPSINAAPMDAFSSRDVTYNSNPFHHYGGVEYQRAAPSAVPVQHPGYYNQPTTTAPARYISPSDAQAARKTTAPTAFRNPVERTPVARESYQQSIDSFYGGIAGQPSSSGYAV